ncbi:hypothetical protein ATPR_2362 [Acetobacter tropicalis NBRC 101654]|uniref:Uncharacterized protein n=1 Tax=Acetobacter tropicalis NBRC 101654 TaxID=749388 RepID=F7VG63_9PROT|nr:hypothetical protein [Acetobacter tropicalis]GAA09358.1 hypothetical protein ATPR_2362 [Acetobacter tropicalis NBRC 101654]
MSGNLYFKGAVTGRIARFFEIFRTQKHVGLKTFWLPLLLCFAAYAAAERAIISAEMAVYFYAFTVLLAGIRRGLAEGFTKPVLPVVQGGAIGALSIVFLALSHPFLSVHQETLTLMAWTRVQAESVLIGMNLFFDGYVYAGGLSEIFLTTEAQWIKGAPRRRVIHKIVRVAMKTEKLEGLPTAQAMIVYALWGIAIIFGFFLQKYINNLSFLSH